MKVLMELLTLYVVVMHHEIAIIETKLYLVAGKTKNSCIYIYNIFFYVGTQFCLMMLLNLFQVLQNIEEDLAEKVYEKICFSSSHVASQFALAFHI